MAEAKLFNNDEANFTAPLVHRTATSPRGNEENMSTPKVFSSGVQPIEAPTEGESLPKSQIKSFTHSPVTVGPLSPYDQAQIDFANNPTRDKSTNPDGTPYDQAQIDFFESNVPRHEGKDGGVGIPGPLDEKGKVGKTGDKGKVSDVSADGDGRLAKANEIETASNQAVQDILDGKDPRAEIEWNNAISTWAPSNQAQAEALMLNMKQRGITDGSFNSYITALALGQNKNLSDIKQNINVNAAKRWEEMVKFGVDRAYDVKIQDLELKIKENQLKEGERANYEDTLDLFQTTIPGSVFNAQAYENIIENDPTAEGAIDSKRQQIRNLINQDTPESLRQAREVLMELATDYPGVFGDPAQYADWDPNDVDKIGAMNRYNDNVAAISTTISSGNVSKAFDDVKDLILDPVQALSDFDDTFTRNGRMGENEEVLDIADLDGDPTLWSDEEKIDYMAADMVWDIKRQGIQTERIYDAYLDTLVGDDHEWLVDNKDHFLQYLNDIDDLVEGPDGLLVPSEKNMLPPWEENSPAAYQYYTWPMYTFDENGDVDQRIYEGMDYKGDGDSPLPDFLDKISIAHNQNMDRKYQQYLKTTDNPLSMKEWYTKTKGGDPEATALLREEEDDPNGGGYPKATSPAEVQEKVDAGLIESLTEDEILMIPSTAISNVPIGKNAVLAWNNGADPTSNPYGGVIKIGNLGLKVIDGGKSKFGASDPINYTVFETAAGNKIYIDENGGMYSSLNPLRPRFQDVGNLNRNTELTSDLLDEYLTIVNEQGVDNEFKDLRKFLQSKGISYD